MEQITLRIQEDTLESLEDEAAEHGISRSEHVRDVLESRNEHGANTGEHEANTDELREEIHELEQELERREALLEDLRSQLKVANSKDERVDELAKYAEHERTQSQRWREAGLGTRMKWKLFGMPEDSADA